MTRILTLFQGPYAATLAIEIPYYNSIFIDEKFAPSPTRLKGFGTLYIQKCPWKKHIETATYSLAIFAGVYYTLYHCHMEMTNSMTITESPQSLFSCKAC